MSAFGTRDRALDGLRAIAAMEEAVATAIDEVGYYGEMAKLLRSSAADRREAVARLSTPREAGSPRLRLVGTGCDHASGKAAS